MRREQMMVQEFHKAFDIPIGDYSAPMSHDRGLRYNLILEEARETCDSLLRGSTEDVVDGLCDLMYVVLGTAVTFGVDLQTCFDEVHRSNMTKVGGHKREDGKWVKPPNYSPADITSAISAGIQAVQDDDYFKLSTGIRKNPAI